MIENLRKHRYIIIIGLIFVIIALVVGIRDTLFQRSGVEHPYIKIGGRTYSEHDFLTLGKASFEVLVTLGQSRFEKEKFIAGDFELNQFVIAINVPTARKDNPIEQFFIGRMILQNSKKEFGIYPSESEINSEIKKLRSFAGDVDEFDENKLHDFINTELGFRGLAESDFREIISDFIVYKKLADIIGTGYAVVPKISNKMMQLLSQEISGEIASMSSENFKKECNPTDDEVKQYWKNLQSRFKTEEMRKFTYFIATPNMPQSDEIKTTTENTTDKKLSEAEKIANDKIEVTKEKERRKFQLDLDKQIDDFAFQLEDQKGEDFEGLVTKNHWQLKKSNLFSQSSPPEDLKVNLRGTEKNVKAVSELFKIESTTDPISKFSQPIAIGKNQWLIARLDEVVRTRDKTYEEAYKEARENLILEKSREKLSVFAKSAYEKVKLNLQAGKTFNEASIAAGFSNVKTITSFTSSYRNPDNSVPPNIFAKSYTVAPGSLAELIINEEQPDFAYIFKISKREIEKEKLATEAVTINENSNAYSFKIITFADWLAQQSDSASGTVERLYR